VTVETSPSRASVVFDNNPSTACQSPCNIALAKGRHTVAATLAGYRQALKIFELPRDATLSIELVRMSGMVRITSEPPGATILVNGQVRSETTPAGLTLPVGKYVITVRKEGYRNAEQELEVKDGAFLSLDFTFFR